MKKYIFIVSCVLLVACATVPDRDNTRTQEQRENARQADFELKKETR